MRSDDGARQHEDCVSTPLACGSECSLNILGTLVRLGIEASLRTPLRRVPSLLTLVRCPGWLKSRGRPRGRAWERSPSEAPVVFRLCSGARVDNPVMFPPGRARLATNPLPTGSLSCVMTMGIVDSRFLGGTGCCDPPVTMTSTLRRTSSAASAGRRSSFPSAYRYSMTMFFPST